MGKKFKVGDELSMGDIQVGMIIDILPINKHFYSYKNIKVVSCFGSGFHFYYMSKTCTHRRESSSRLFYKGLAGVEKSSPETSSQQHNVLDEQSIRESVKTLSQAAQELSTGISVDEEGNIVTYSDYHQDEIKFDTTEKFMKYVECVKQMNKFGGS